MLLVQWGVTRTFSSSTGSIYLVHNVRAINDPEQCYESVFVIQMSSSLQRCTKDFYIPIQFLFTTDVDECFQELDDCDNAVTECINVLGSYICSCYKQNYAWDGKTCVGKEFNIHIKIVPLVCLKVFN